MSEARNFEAHRDLSRESLANDYFVQESCEDFGSHKISVIIRTLGSRITYLREALESLNNRHQKHVEVIIVCHNGVPTTMESLNNIRFWAESNLGLDVQLFNVLGGSRGRPLNEGLRRATGCLISFLDDDDVVLPAWSCALLAAHSEDPEAVIRGQVWLQHHEELTPGVRRPVSNLLDVYPHVFDLDKQIVENQAPIHAYGLPSKLLKVHSLTFDEELEVLEDWDFFTRVALRTKVVDFEQWIAIYKCDRRILTVEAESVWTGATIRVRRKLSVEEAHFRVLVPNQQPRLEGEKSTLNKTVIFLAKSRSINYRVKQSVSYWFMLKYVDNLSWARRVFRPGTRRHRLLKFLAEKGTGGRGWYSK